MYAGQSHFHIKCVAATRKFCLQCWIKGPCYCGSLPCFPFLAPKLVVFSRPSLVFFCEADSLCRLPPLQPPTPATIRLDSTAGDREKLTFHPWRPKNWVIYGRPARA